MKQPNTKQKFNWLVSSNIYVTHINHGHLQHRETVFFVFMHPFLTFHSCPGHICLCLCVRNAVDQRDVFVLWIFLFWAKRCNLTAQIPVASGIKDKSQHGDFIGVCFHQLIVVINVVFKNITKSVTSPYQGKFLLATPSQERI